MDYRVATHNPWIIPGTQKKKVRTMLIKRSLPAPRAKNTPKGGSSIHKMIMTSLLMINPFYSMKVQCINSIQSIEGPEGVDALLP
jgi:hypothetical protein